MADTHEHSAEGDHGNVFRAYIIIFVVLSVCTALSFIVNAIFHSGSVTGASIIMMVAVVKAGCVGYIFMHLKWDWRKVYFLIIPVFILAVTMMFVLMPDLLFGSQ